MTRWKVGLSNGAVHVEGHDLFQVVPGELSPWLKLMEYLKQRDLTITSLSIISGGDTFNLPSAGNNPKFKAFADAKKPLSFNFYRMLGADLNGDRKTDLFSVAEAVYTTYRLQLWVEDFNPQNCWVLVKDEH